MLAGTSGVVHPSVRSMSDALDGMPEDMVGTPLQRPRLCSILRAATSPDEVLRLTHDFSYEGDDTTDWLNSMANRTKLEVSSVYVMSDTLVLAQIPVHCTS